MYDLGYNSNLNDDFTEEIMTFEWINSNFTETFLERNPPRYKCLCLYVACVSIFLKDTITENWTYLLLYIYISE